MFLGSFSPQSRSLSLLESPFFVDYIVYFWSSHFFLWSFSRSSLFLCGNLLPHWNLNTNYTKNFKEIGSAHHSQRGQKSGNKCQQLKRQLFQILSVHKILMLFLSPKQNSLSCSWSTTTKHKELFWSMFKSFIYLTCCHHILKTKNTLK